MDFPRYDTNFYGKLLRRCLDGKHGNFIGLDPYIASAIYASDRLESKPIIEGNLSGGTDMVLDRYVSASIIHQGGKLRDEQERTRYVEWCEELEFGLNGLPRPDITVYLSLDVSVSMKLARERAVAKGESPDQAEGDARHQHESKESAVSVIRRLNNWVLVDCNDGLGGILSVEAVHQKIWDAVKHLFA
jgi:dTMP kinase